MKITKATELEKGKNFSALIYAPPGSGKTTTIKYLPGKTLVIDVDRTTNVLAGEPNIDIVYADINDVEVGFAQMLEEIHDNYIEDYDNIVIDNISELEQAWLGEKAKKSKTKDGRAMGIPEMGDYNKFSFYLPNLIRYVNSWEGVNKVYTAWETTRQIETSSGQLYNQFIPQIREKIITNIMGLVNIVGRLVINEETGGRGFILQPSNGTFAKNQLSDAKFAKQEDIWKVG
ncbi:DNA-binding protein [Streptococcus agalactiae LMG 14747]|uniref:DNA-binding protein n=1 Tax=Streptococcus agalactiae LMG 14747 TaxID=1154860 RepID=V6Z2H1_STRAG|nr:DNA-binding protein [Streptococcus agalactiae LMG 14747]